LLFCFQHDSSCGRYGVVFMNVFRVDNLYFFIVALAAFFSLLVTVVVIVFAVWHRPQDPLSVGARIHGSIPLEFAWSVIPFIVSVVIFAWAAEVFIDF
jgi:heme/copper-type cytochrome/quinol oxidase subunit 2